MRKLTWVAYENETHIFVVGCLSELSHWMACTWLDIKGPLRQSRHVIPNTQITEFIKTAMFAKTKHVQVYENTTQAWNSRPERTSYQWVEKLMRAQVSHA